MTNIGGIVQELANDGFLVVFAVFLLIPVGIHALICWYLSSCLMRLPETHRRLSPALVWLLLIPCFQFIWGFFVYPKVAKSFQAHFQAVGRHEMGDCGHSLAMWYCVLSVVSLPLNLVPILNLLNCIIWPATLVLWIMTMVKFANLKRQVTVR